VENIEKYGFMEDEIYPLVIIRDRYTGVYSGGKYTAWSGDVEDILPPPEVEADDVVCRNFWYAQEDNPTYMVGKGNTVSEALADLYIKLKQRGELFG
jgi:hypothetical protein